MPTITNQTLADNLYANFLTERDFQDLVYDRSRYKPSMATIANALNFSTGGELTTAANGKYEYSWSETSAISTPILNQVPSGAKLVLSVSPSFDLIREGNLVADSNDKLAIVTNVSAGSITIEPFGYAFNSATDFITGMVLKDGNNISSVHSTQGSTSQYVVPISDFNYVPTLRDTCMLWHTDNIMTYPKYGANMWSSAQMDFMMERIARADEFHLFLGQRQSVYSTLYKDTVNDCGGIDWSITNRGGLDIKMTSAPTFAQFNRTLFDFRTNAKSGQKPITILTGTAFQQYAQLNWFANMILPSGVNNTFGGHEVKGLNVTKYSIAGVDIEWGILDYLDEVEKDPTPVGIAGMYGTKLQNTMYMCDLSPIPIMSPETGKTRPAIEVTYWLDKVPSMGLLQGMPNGKMPIGNSSTSNYQPINSPVAGSQVEYLCRKGYNIPFGNKFAKIHP